MSELFQMYICVVLMTLSLSSLIACGFNRYYFSFSKYEYHYRSGFVKWSIKLPILISIIMYFFPYRKKLPIAGLIMTLVAYLSMLTCYLNKVFGFSSADGLARVLIWILVTVDVVCVAEVMIDSKLNTAKEEEKLNKYPVRPYKIK